MIAQIMHSALLMYDSLDCDFGMFGDKTLCHAYTCACMYI